MRSLIAVALSWALSSPALALMEPAAGKSDPRMETAAYDPAQVYAVHVPKGQSMAIVLGSTEAITDGFGADKKTLRADPSGNVLVLWASDADLPPRTMFIRSHLPDGTMRTYSLLVDSRPADQAAVSLTFTYASEDAARKAAAWRAAAAARAQQAAVDALNAAHNAPDSNFKYVLQGSTPSDWNLLPTRQVSDNSTDTHFTFPGNMRVPIIYAVNPDGKEAVADYTFDSSTGVATVHQLATAFHLRDGDSLLCVFNHAFDPVGVRSTTGTVSADVQRVVR